jgi:uncharacterized Zn-binding protein involved in type VI secretion
MRVPIVRHGDETATRGKVVAYSATIHDDGRKIALHGDQVTCGNCKGLWKIIGTGEGVGENGRVAVINGDHVLCPCKKNRVFAGADAGMFIHIDTGARNGGAAEASQAALQPPAHHYDEQFTLHDANGHVLRDTYYTVRLPSGSLVHGVTDHMGRTERYETEGAQSIRIYLGHRELA